MWELDGTLEIRVGSTLKIAGQVRRKSFPRSTSGSRPQERLLEDSSYTFFPTLVDGLALIDRIFLFCGW